MSSPDIPSPSLSFDQLSVYFSQFAEIVGQQLYVRFPFIFFTGKPGGGGNIDFGGATISGANLAPSLPQLTSVGSSGESLVNDGSSITGYKIKELVAGTGISLFSTTTGVTISNSSTVTVPDITAVGSGTSIIKDGSSTTGFTLKTLTTGTNISFTNNTNDIQVNGPASTTLTDVGSGESWTGAPQTGPTLTLRTAIAGSNMTIAESGDRRSLIFTAGTTPAEYTNYTTVYYTTQAYTSTNSMSIALSKNNTTNIVTASLDWTLGGSFVTSNEVLGILPAAGPLPAGFLPATSKVFPVGPIIINTGGGDLNWPALLLMDTSGNFSLKFYDQTAIQPDVTSSNFPSGATVTLKNLPFTYNQSV